MRFAYLAVGLALLAPRLAHANECNAVQTFVSPNQLPLGCPIRVLLPFPSTLTSSQVTVQRSANVVTTTMTITHVGDTQVPVTYDEPDADHECNPRYYTQDRAYDEWTVALDNLQVGDEVSAGSVTVATVVAAGACPTALDAMPQCSAPIQTYEECKMELGLPPYDGNNYPDGGIADPDDDHPSHNGGCAASSPSSLAIGALSAVMRCSVCAAGAGRSDSC